MGKYKSIWKKFGSDIKNNFDSKTDWNKKSFLNQNEILRWWTYIFSR